jgi:hypothetical protein
MQRVERIGFPMSGAVCLIRKPTLHMSSLYLLPQKSAFKFSTNKQTKRTSLDRHINRTISIVQDQSMNIKDQRSFDLNRQQREKLIAGYADAIEEKMFGRVAHYINFMFNSIPGKRGTKIEIMNKDVTRAFGLLLRSTVRKPESIYWQASRPIFIGCPDLPVIKREKQHIRNFIVNNGLHFNAICLSPAICGEGRQLAHRFVPRSRLKVSLDEHFRLQQNLYQTEHLYRVHVTPITDGKMADYTFKTFKNGNVSGDDILVLN